MLGRLGLFAYFTLSHTPFRTLVGFAGHGPASQQSPSLPSAFVHLVTVFLKKKEWVNVFFEKPFSQVL